jgi:glutamine amidotransferase
MNTIAVIDYGMGNLHSVAKAIEHAPGNCKVIVTHAKNEILAADRVVFPGVGAMRDCIGEIKRLELDDVIQEVSKNKPFLGVCVGMQALMEYSAENNGVDCLNILPGRVELFDAHRVNTNSERLKVPHMGWNKVTQHNPHPLWEGIAQDSRFYFVHSYYVSTSDNNHEAASTDYGIKFTSAVAHENIFAVQFHPEKSQHLGLKLYDNFIHWDGNP